VAPDGISTLPIPAGVGGGFVKTGPFANMSVNLGPVGGLNGTAPGPDGGLGYNPRGLKRDVGPAVNMRYANYSTVLSKSCGCSLYPSKSSGSNILITYAFRPLIEA
jgi:tyrosinase